MTLDRLKELPCVRVGVWTRERDPDGVVNVHGFKCGYHGCPWLGEGECPKAEGMNAVQLIALERQRQVAEEGYGIDHDSEHDLDDLACAGAWYAMPHELRETILDDGDWGIWPEQWEFKPTPEDRVRELVKAGALIAAEIDRLQEPPA